MYDGEFKLGQNQGIGVLRFCNGDVYEGQFIDGKFEGKGKFMSAHGSVHEGEFKAGTTKAEDFSSTHLVKLIMENL